MGFENMVKRDGEGAWRDIYLLLLRVCMHPPTSAAGQRTTGWGGGRNSTMVEPTLKIMRAHAARIDTTRALALLPDNLQISDPNLKVYLQSALRKVEHKRKNSQILRNLLKLEQLQAMRERAQLQKKYVIITSKDVCQICQRPFSSRSVPAIFPDGTFYHVACTNGDLKNDPLHR